MTDRRSFHPPNQNALRGAMPIEIGIVNNMPDAAVRSTELQFRSLLARAAGPLDIRLHLFMIPEILRSTEARSAMSSRYTSVERIQDFSLDALIVTGCEPKAADICDEPYWAALTRLVDWSRMHTISTIWSCLAAHGAVQHLDGIGRRALKRKRFGVFDCDLRCRTFLEEAPSFQIRVPHSRFNELDESQLTENGYTILTASREAGVDAFFKRDKSLFLFFQGHPEYDRRALLHEFRRDLLRFVRRESGYCPSTPRNYFGQDTYQAINKLLEDAGPTLDVSLMDVAIEQGERAICVDWFSWATYIYKGWLSTIANEKLAFSSTRSDGVCLSHYSDEFISSIS